MGSVAFFMVIAIATGLEGSVHCSRCPAGFSATENNHCYRYIENSEMSWYDASSYCSSLEAELPRLSHISETNDINDFVIKSQIEEKSLWFASDDKGNFMSAEDCNVVLFSSRGAKSAKRPCMQTAHFICMATAKKRDCLDWLQDGSTESGIYIIYPDQMTGFLAYCDMTTSEGGWTVIQRRTDGKLAFWNQLWSTYKAGFGDSNFLSEGGNGWLGNEAIHLLTANGNSKLRIQLEGDRNPGSAVINGFLFGEYDFKVYSEAEEYKLYIHIDYRNMVGNASTGWYDITYSNDRPFSTIDRINDPVPSCVTKYHLGGWWLHNCAFASLNGQYVPPVVYGDLNGMMWTPNGYDYVINPRTSVMMVRRTA